MSRLVYISTNYRYNKENPTISEAMIWNLQLKDD